MERPCWPPRRRPYALRLRRGDPAWREPPDEKGTQGPDRHDLDSSPSFAASIDLLISAASGPRCLDFLVAAASIDLLISVDEQALAQTSSVAVVPPWFRDAQERAPAAFLGKARRPVVPMSAAAATIVFLEVVLWREGDDI